MKSPFCNQKQSRHAIVQIYVCPIGAMQPTYWFQFRRCLRTPSALTSADLTSRLASNIETNIELILISARFVLYSISRFLSPLPELHFSVHFYPAYETCPLDGSGLRGGYMRRQFSVSAIWIRFCAPAVFWRTYLQVEA